MGEAKQKRSATARLIAQFPYCALCAGLRPATTRDHVPPKALFNNSFRPDKLVVPACGECNGGTSTADLIASIVCRWNYFSDDQERTDHSRLVARLRKQCPEVIREWMHLKDADRARSHLRKHGVAVPHDAGLVSIGEITIRHLNLFAYKLALGFFFEHFAMPLPSTGLVSAIWRTKEDFAKLGVPPELLEMLPKYGRLQQGRWETSDEFEYRFDTNSVDGIIGCLARLRTGLYITTFAVRDGDILPERDRTIDWIRPRDLLSILERAEFRRRIH